MHGMNPKPQSFIRHISFWLKSGGLWGAGASVFYREKVVMEKKKQ